MLRRLRHPQPMILASLMEERGDLGLSKFLWPAQPMSPSPVTTLPSHGTRTVSAPGTPGAARQTGWLPSPRAGTAPHQRAEGE